jgi:hypothetical protein
VRLLVRSHGLVLELLVEPARLLPSVRARLPPDHTISRRPCVADRAWSLIRVRDGFELSRARGRPHLTLTLADALERLESEVNLFVAEHARDRLFVHAGVVAWRGRAILVPGRSGSGKSTLVAALVRAGARYYSDEYAVLDADGRVHPFPRPLSLRRADGSRARRSHVALGGRAGARPIEVSLVLACRYRPRGRPGLRPLSPGRMVLALLKHTVAARSRPELAFTCLEQVASRARGLYGVRKEAAAFAGRILGGELP